MSTNQSISIFMLDNVDSFTYNLVNELEVAGYDLHVYRNTLTADSIIARLAHITQPVLLLLSPGPGAPHDAGCMPELIKRCKGKYPILGICLGHQGLIESYGGVIDRAGETMHGKSSFIDCVEHPIFSNLPKTLSVARYHSLAATQVPENIDVIASYTREDGLTIPMAYIHEADRTAGFQFHPESILTPEGATLLTNCVAYLTRQEDS